MGCVKYRKKKERKYKKNFIIRLLYSKITEKRDGRAVNNLTIKLFFARIKPEGRSHGY